MPFFQAIDDCIAGGHKQFADELKMLLTLNFQTFENVQLLERISFCSGMNKTKRFIFLPRKTQKTQTRNLLFFVLFMSFVKENYSRLIWNRL